MADDSGFRGYSMQLKNHDLSRRESQVLDLISNGLTNKEIATQLMIGEATVKQYLRLLFVKFEVSNRTQLAILSLKGNASKNLKISRRSK